MMGSLKISPSLLCMNFLAVGQQICVLNDVADSYHCDVIDNDFAPLFGFSMEMLQQIKAIAAIPLDAHLMVRDVERTTEMVLAAGADVVTVPIEGIANNAFRVFSRVRAAGAKVGVSINPITPLESLQLALPAVDKVTVLMFDPGAAGQRLVDGTLGKVCRLVELRNACGAHFDIELDGSCNRENFRRMACLGADQLVVGRSGLFRLDDDIETAWRKMKEYMIDYESAP